ncbi:MAG TPA: hypothetical protein VFL55_26190 [Acetobacteraceae bacterium]|nr:hypothetical protein [Acetobacteraceae bacterium]
MSQAVTATRRQNPAARGSQPSPEAPRPIGRVLSTPQFWELMERWKISDATALELIDYPGKLGTSGKRPRFRFTTHQQRITAYLVAIENELANTGTELSWLHRRIGSAPFAGKSPIERMLAKGLEGMNEVVKLLSRTALRKSLRERLDAAS